MKCALVTGASRGIGRSIASQLSKDHRLHILVNYSADDRSATEMLENLRREGGTGELLKFKIQDKTAVDTALQNWQDKNPEKFIHVLVNNAGIARDSLFMWMPEAHWDEVTSVALKGFFNVTQHTIRRMMHEKNGRIISLSSISGLKGVPGQVNYSAAKSGIIGATKALAQEVARMNITVNAVAPGLIRTSMAENISVEKYVNLIPMGRVGEPEEVAHVVSFLASDKASYISGEVINVNGGLHS
jgi:3-oxoacyl-[acyl-carrier protein] reductase